MHTFSTSNGSIATLYPRLPTRPNDDRCHLHVHQNVELAFRHLYDLATDARWIQTQVDKFISSLEVIVQETEHYAETSSWLRKFSDLLVISMKFARKCNLSMTPSESLFVNVHAWVCRRSGY